MIAINDNYADGRDMSWLWDVDFSILKHSGVQAISGSRAYDMAIRLFHDDVEFNEENIDLSISESVQNFIKGGRDKKRIYATYNSYARNSKRAFENFRIGEDFMNLKILWLYAENMNIYGDYGNILALKKTNGITWN